MPSFRRCGMYRDGGEDSERERLNGHCAMLHKTAASRSESLTIRTWLKCFVSNIHARATPLRVHFLKLFFGPGCMCFRARGCALDSHFHSTCAVLCSVFYFDERRRQGNKHKQVHDSSGGRKKSINAISPEGLP
jgi:hypothetical protein